MIILEVYNRETLTWASGIHNYNHTGNIIVGKGGLPYHEIARWRT